jgi:hypothetical protein
MTATFTDTRNELDDALYQSVVDEEFREMVLAHPETFGLTSRVPDPVDAQDRSLLDLVSGVQFTTMCGTTCSSTVFTIVCDGSTK